MNKEDKFLDFLLNMAFQHSKRNKQENYRVILSGKNVSWWFLEHKDRGVCKAKDLSFSIWELLYLFWAVYFLDYKNTTVGKTNFRLKNSFCCGVENNEGKKYYFQHVLIFLQSFLKPSSSWS